MRKTILIFLVFTLFLPLFFSIVKIDLMMKIDRPLDGVYEAPPRPEISLKNIFNGNFQGDFEKYFNYKLWGRATMSRIYNQIIYSVFKSTDNSRVLIGKDGYLFEPWYAQVYLDEPIENQKLDLHNKMVMLTSLQKTFEEMGKRLFVIITPSKASIYPEYLPNDYHKYAVLKNSNVGGGGIRKIIMNILFPAPMILGLNILIIMMSFLSLKKKEWIFFQKAGRIGTEWPL
jgi:hypothetical protein